MLQMQEMLIPKDQLLRDFLTFKKWLTDYWSFLETLPLDVFVEQEHVVEYLRDQHHRLVATQVKLHTLDMVAALLSFSLSRIQPAQLVFRIPIKAPELPPAEYEEIVSLSHQAQKLEKSLQALVDQVMYLARHLPSDSEERLTPLLQAIGSLFKAIIRQDGDDMKVQVSQINLLTSTKDSFLLVQEIGKITRDIYNSLQDLSTNLDTEDIRHATDEMPDAVQKLNSVIKRLEDATNDNLEFLEKLLQQSEENIRLTEDLSNELNNLQQHLDALCEKYPDMLDDIAPLMQMVQSQLQAKTQNLLNTFHENENLFITIMTNQGFQDLTGQTLKKIIDFIEHLELRLLDLIQKYSGGNPKATEKKRKETSAAPEGESILTRVDTGIEDERIELHGPDETENKKSSQNDVDSLLAQLGF